MKIMEKLRKYDPAEYVKGKYRLKGWKAEVVDLVFGFITAAVLYFVIMPLVLGAYPPAVVVQSCSMNGTLNVGDIVVLRGTSYDDINAPEVHINAPFGFTVYPEDPMQETERLIFPDGQELAVEETGDIIVYDSKTSRIQIIHRVIAKVDATDGRYYVIKGDSNNLPDYVNALRCEEWVSTMQGRQCTKASVGIYGLCDESDVGWPGCLSSPVKEGEIVGKQLLWIPLFGHVKLAFFHIITLGHGYPAELWC